MALERQAVIRRRTAECTFVIIYYIKNYKSSYLELIFNEEMSASLICNLTTVTLVTVEKGRQRENSFGKVNKLMIMK